MILGIFQADSLLRAPDLLIKSIKADSKSQIEADFIEAPGSNENDNTTL
jgi:hypothetical protein